MSEMSLGSLATFVKFSRLNKQLIVQPRMGFSSIQKMQHGLKSVKCANALTVGTITLDSFTRQRDYKTAQMTLDSGQELNGFPIVNHGAGKILEMLNDIVSPHFPVQVRHGTPNPLDVFKVLMEANIDATEGGPVSYCLPYTRTSLSSAITAWSEACELFSSHKNNGFSPHIESFAGCMLGQLCSPSLLIALSVLEGIFFKQHGIDSVSFSYAQGTNMTQDQAAILVLRSLVTKYVSSFDWHIVIYTYMGVFPQTISGAKELICDSARLAKLTGSERLIVKTPAEASRIPTVKENIESLELANEAFLNEPPINKEIDQEEYEQIYQEAECLINAVLNLSGNINQAILLAFKKGYLDVPYCLHVDNLNKTRTTIDNSGYLRWENTGFLPLPRSLFLNRRSNSNRVSSSYFLQMLGYMRQKYDFPCEGYN